MQRVAIRPFGIDTLKMRWMQLVNSVPNVVSADIIIKKVCAAWQFRGENGGNCTNRQKCAKNADFSIDT